MAQLQRYHKASKQKLPLERRKPIMLICLALLVVVTLVVGLLSVVQIDELKVIPQDTPELGWRTTSWDRQADTAEDCLIPAQESALLPSAPRQDFGRGSCHTRQGLLQEYHPQRTPQS